MVSDSYRPQDGDTTGFSNSMSFDEAFKEAIGQLKPVKPSHPDEMFRVSVVAIGSESGGIAGLSRLFVTVRRNPRA